MTIWQLQTKCHFAAQISCQRACFFGDLQSKGRNSRFTLSWSSCGAANVFDVVLPHGIPAFGFQERAQ